MAYENIPSYAWKGPVATVGDLPAQGNSDGDARVVLADDSIYIWDEDSQTWIASGGGGGTGDVVGPASSTDNAVARFDGITGKLLQDSTVLIDDGGSVSGLAGLLFAVDGTGNIGNSTDNRPGSISATSRVFVGVGSGYEIILSQDGLNDGGRPSLFLTAPDNKFVLEQSDGEDKVIFRYGANPLGDGNLMELHTNGDLFLTGHGGTPRLLFESDGVGTIGANGANRPEFIYAASQFLAADGSNALPSYSFATNPDTGVWTNGSELLLGSGGVAVMEIQSNGEFNMVANTGTANIRWATDGGGSIGGVGASRPANIRLTEDVVAGGQVFVSDGTITDPAYTFSSSTNTGYVWTGGQILTVINGSTIIETDGNGEMNLLGTGGTSNIRWGTDGGGFVGGLNGNSPSHVSVRTLLKTRPITEAQRDALTAEAGMIVFNSDAGKHQGYDGATWNDLY